MSMTMNNPEKAAKLAELGATGKQIDSILYIYERSTYLLNKIWTAQEVRWWTDNLPMSFEINERRYIQIEYAGSDNGVGMWCYDLEEGSQTSWTATKL
jgi:hypothetical protein